jgi:hypothetical protein
LGRFKGFGSHFFFFKVAKRASFGVFTTFADVHCLRSRRKCLKPMFFDVFDFFAFLEVQIAYVCHPIDPTMAPQYSTGTVPYVTHQDTSIGEGIRPIQSNACAHRSKFYKNRKNTRGERSKKPVAHTRPLDCSTRSVPYVTHHVTSIGEGIGPIQSNACAHRSKFFKNRKNTRGERSKKSLALMRPRNRLIPTVARVSARPSYMVIFLELGNSYNPLSFPSTCLLPSPFFPFFFPLIKGA